MDNVSLDGSCARIPQRSPDETLSVYCILPLEKYAHCRTLAIMKQLQFHMACSFEIEVEKRGGGSQVVKKSESANIDVPFSKSVVVQLGVYSTCLTTNTSHFYFPGKLNEQLHSTS